MSTAREKKLLVTALLYFTPVGISSLFSKDALTQSIGAFALDCSTAGWMICGLTIWGATRLIRAENPESPPTDSSS